MRKDTPAGRHKYWSCPFFKWDGHYGISCEAGRTTFPDQDTANEYMNQYCASNPGWKKCSLAAKLYDFYEKKEEANDEKCRQDKSSRKSERES